MQATTQYVVFSLCSLWSIHLRLQFAALRHPWLNSLPNEGRAAPPARPLWGEQAAQVANTQALAEIGNFLHFFLDLLSLYAKIANL
jgi:hypothetical protein